MPRAHPDSPRKRGVVGDGKAAGVIIAAVAVVAVIGVGVYLAVHHGHSLKGCTSSSPSGLEVINDGDQKTYALTGDLEGIKPGDRIHLSGNRIKNASKANIFSVTKLSKVYGACKVP